ncbi:LysE family translocator [Microbacterium lacusdiani]
MLPSLVALWSFALVVALLTITPGLDTALVLRTAAVSGRGRAWGVLTGIQFGVLAWGVLAAAGISAVLLASEVAYTVLRIAGAAYVIWLGLRLLWSAIRGAHGPDEAVASRDDSFLAGLRQGLVTNMLNPKVGAFYIALLPQFIPADAPQLAWGASLAGVHVLLGTVWLGALLLLARRVGPWLRRPRVTRIVDAVAGTAIVAFGVRLAAEGTHR